MRISENSSTSPPIKKYIYGVRKRSSAAVADTRVSRKAYAHSQRLLKVARLRHASATPEAVEDVDGSDASEASESGHDSYQHGFDETDGIDVGFDGDFGKEDLRAVFVVFGYPWKRSDDKAGWKVLLAVPAAMSNAGVLLPVTGQLPLYHVEFFEPQLKPRKPVLGKQSLPSKKGPFCLSSRSNLRPKCFCKAAHPEVVSARRA